MANFSADPDGMEQLAGTVVQMIEGAFVAIECLANSGSHGSRQGVAIQASVTEFQTQLGPNIVRALNEVREHGETTQRLAAIVKAHEAGLVGMIGKAQSESETELQAGARDFNDAASRSA
ncbi:hypothetical protein GOEFS_039_00100 [Gordonia effusa NBRC 100432]|uniref:Uncharacterized protein n=1 Tax=Gordonia effusa NBRC 100432 TaxID=1077974 RepID=H0QY75_9ACTN|nr:hypothetical protein [Gordonia effusa]GAB17776.1 hypothetical protein GOEFS_039_00100 [Gordonia effusa NBRC 100432]